MHNGTKSSLQYLSATHSARRFDVSGRISANASHAQYRALTARDSTRANVPLTKAWPIATVGSSLGESHDFS